MQPHKSVDDHYKQLFAEDPLISGFSQVTKDHWPIKEIELDLVRNSCERRNSFVYSGSCRTLKYSDGKLNGINKYDFIFLIAVNTKDDKKYLAPVTNNKTWEIDIKQCNFYDQFLCHSFDKVRFIQCGDRNSHTDLIKTNGIWCKHCHGFLHLPNIHKMLMHESMRFSDIPKESLLYIEEEFTPIGENDYPSVQQLLKEEEERLIQLQKDIDDATAGITDFIMKQMASTERNKVSLQMLCDRDITLTLIKETMDDINNKIEEIEKDKERAKLQEEEDNLKKEQAKIEEQRIALEKKAAALKLKMKFLSK